MVTRGAWPDLGYRPPPPELPKYDPKEEAPKWSWSRLWWGSPVERGEKPWTEIGTQPKSPDDPDWRGVIRNNVIEYKMPDTYTYGNYTDPKYFWFDTPDYADPFKKLGYSFKFFTMTGLLVSSLKGVAYSWDFTVANNLKLATTIVIPWVIAGMVGSTTAVCLANLRGKKDDVYNYLAAGFVMGCVLGRRNHISFFRWVSILTPCGYVVKYNAETNGMLAPKINPRLQRNPITGSDGDHGISSGDLRPFGFRGRYPDPGRDVRTPY